MRGVTHLLIGAAIGAAVARGQPLVDAATIISAGALAGLLPDIDHPGSIISRRVLLPLHVLFTHRGLTHSVIGLASFTLLILLIPHITPETFTAAFLGYGAHLVADALTRSGIALFWPFGVRVRLLALRTGGVVDTLLMVAALGAALSFLLR